MITEQTKAELNRLEIFEDIVEAVTILRTRPGGEWLGSMFLFSNEASIRTLVERAAQAGWPPVPKILTLEEIRDYLQVQAGTDDH